MRARAVELVAELADEPDPEREARHARDLELPRVEVPEARRSRRRRRVSARERLARPRPGDVDRGERAGDVDDLDVDAARPRSTTRTTRSTASEPVEVVVT